MFVGFSVVVGGSPHETKIHTEFATAGWQLGSSSRGRLFPNVSLFFKVHVSKWMIIKAGGGAGDVSQEGI